MEEDYVCYREFKEDCLLQKEFEDAWGVKVLDRYSVVLHIFRRNARTREAKLQISLAEIPLLRSGDGLSTARARH